MGYDIYKNMILKIIFFFKQYRIYLQMGYLICKKKIFKDRKEHIYAINLKYALI